MATPQRRMSTQKEILREYCDEDVGLAKRCMDLLEETNIALAALAHQGKTNTLQSACYMSLTSV